MRKQYHVRLSVEERRQLDHLIATGTAPARTLAHARILLKADTGSAGPALPDDIIATAVEVSRPTIARVRKRYAEAGLTAALERRRPRRHYARKLDGRQEAHLIALACGAPPAGQARWTLRLLAGRMVALEVVDTLSHETVRRVLKKTRSSRG